MQGSTTAENSAEKNKNCHFCEHAPKRCSIFGCLSETCDQMFCENCCKRHLVPRSALLFVCAARWIVGSPCAACGGDRGRGLVLIGGLGPLGSRYQLPRAARRDCGQLAVPDLHQVSRAEDVGPGAEGEEEGGEEGKREKKGVMGD